MTFIEKFNELKAQIPTVEAGTFGENFAIQVTMTDEECGGTFYIANIDGVFSVEPYDYKDHTARVSAPAAFLDDLVAGKADPVKAFMFGHVRVEGNFEHIKMLAPLLQAPKKAKRTARAKTAAKAKADDTETKPKRTSKKKTDGEAAPKKTTAKKTSKKSTETK